MKKAILGAVTTALISASGLAGAADNKTGELGVDVRLGISPFLGVLSVELQPGHYAVGIGMPGHLAATYYRNPRQNSVFYSAGLAHYNYSGYNDYEEGYYFTGQEVRALNIGGGYRWQWQSGWNVAASAALQYGQDTYTNPNAFAFEPYKLEKEHYGLALGLAGGYVF